MECPQSLLWQLRVARICLGHWAAAEDAEWSWSGQQQRAVFTHNTQPISTLPRLVTRAHIVRLALTMQVEVQVEVS